MKWGQGYRLEEVVTHLDITGSVHLHPWSWGWKISTIGHLQL